VTRKKTTQEVPRFPRVVESFTDPGHFYVSTEPSSVNTVSIRKYRITIEQVDEPVEVLRERLLLLWRKCNNHHEKLRLQEEAERLGCDLPNAEFGMNAPKRTY